MKNLEKWFELHRETDWLSRFKFNLRIREQICSKKLPGATPEQLCKLRELYRGAHLVTAFLNQYAKDLEEAINEGLIDREGLIKIK